MRNIIVGDEVVAIELWPKQLFDGTEGGLEFEQTTHDCRLYGFCIAVNDDGTIKMGPDMADETGWGLDFPTAIPVDAKPGDSVAMHIDDAKEMFPIRNYADILRQRRLV